MPAWAGTVENDYKSKYSSLGDVVCVARLNQKKTTYAWWILTGPFDYNDLFWLAKLTLTDFRGATNKYTTSGRWASAEYGAIPHELWRGFQIEIGASMSTSLSFLSTRTWWISTTPMRYSLLLGSPTYSLMKLSQSFTYLSKEVVRVFQSNFKLNPNHH